jgi:hypothetical protein
MVGERARSSQPFTAKRRRGTGVLSSFADQITPRSRVRYADTPWLADTLVNDTRHTETAMHKWPLALAANIYAGTPDLSCPDSTGEMKDLIHVVVISLLVMPRVGPHFDP